MTFPLHTKDLYRDFQVILLLVLVGGSCGVLYNWSLLNKSLLLGSGQLPLTTATIPQGLKQIDLAETKSLFDAGAATFVDARKNIFYLQKHIAGAINLPYTQAEPFWTDFQKKFDKETPFVFYCTGYDCEDSHVLAQKLKEDGYTRLAVFHGGFPEWEQAGYPTESSLNTVAGQ